MAKQSAGILLYRLKNNTPEFFLVHPGGPFWKNKDEGAWSIPKGEFADEDPLVAAKRELDEEVGIKCNGPFLPLKPVKQKSGKIVYAWAAKKDVDPALLTSNFFEMEWPPKSGKMQSFPEVDKGGWFGASEAKKKINSYQGDFIEELALILDMKKKE